MSDLTAAELKDFGPIVQRLELALVRAYNASHPKDKIELVHLVRLGESTLGEKAEWHLHWHMVPRTSSTKPELAGWDIVKSRGRRLKRPPSRVEIEAIMDRLRRELRVD